MDYERALTLACLERQLKGSKEATRHSMVGRYNVANEDTKASHGDSGPQGTEVL